MDEQTFIRALQENPADDSLRLVFADFLEDRGDPKSELLRLTQILTQAIHVANRPLLEDRLRELLAAGVKPLGPFFKNSLGMEFAWIPAGEFLMGSPPNEVGRHPNETLHRVKLNRGFFMAVHPVTQEHWQAVFGDEPSHFQGQSNLPVEQVSWEDCREFTLKLHHHGKKAYRLPTEAEWEYACRAGTTTPYSFGTTVTPDQVNYGGEYTPPNGKKTTSVGNYPANAFGLRDMHGNIAEWCLDWYGTYPTSAVVDPKGLNTGIRKVLRGGSWLGNPRSCRSASRSMEVPAYHSNHVGFRVCFTPE